MPTWDDDEDQESKAAEGWRDLFGYGAKYLKKKWDESGENIHSILAAADRGDYEPLMDSGTELAMSTVGDSPKPKFKGLDMNEAARMARAKKMGFDTGKTMYHGAANDIKAFDPKASGRASEVDTGAFFFTDNPKVADEFAEYSSNGWFGRALDERTSQHPKMKEIDTKFKNADIDLNEWTIQRALLKEELRNQGANIYPVHLKTNKPYTIDWEGDYIEPKRVQELVAVAKKRGYDSVVIQNAKDSPQETLSKTITAVFEPSQIRSKFAVFDPKKAGSGNLSAALGGVGLGTGALMTNSQNAEASDKMPSGSWKDRAIAVDTSRKPSWKDRAQPVQLDAPKVSLGESALRGAAQGASLGFEDELAGLGGVAGNELGKLGVDQVEATSPELQAKLDAIAEQNIPSAMDVYWKSRDEERKANLAAAEVNPGTFLAGSVAGGIANPVSRVASSLPGAIGFGATQGIGSSESDLTKGKVSDAAIDTVIGAGTGAAGYGVGKAIPKVFDWIKAGGKKALTNFGPSGEAIEARLAGKAQDTARSYPELAEDMAGSLKALGEKTSELDHAAWGTLSKEPEIPKVTVTHAIDQAMGDIGVQGKQVGAVDKQVARVLGSLKEDLNQLSGNISESDLKGIIKNMDDNINWDDQSMQKLNSTLQAVRTKLDEGLKFRNPAYKKAMEPVAEQTGLLQNLRRKFNFQSEAGSGLTPTDTTASKIQASLRDNKAVTEGELKRLAELTGKDYSELANDYRLAQQFQKAPGARGSKRTNIGAALGAGVGGLTGGFVGAGAGASVGSLAGGAMDAYGGKAVGKLIDTYLKAGNSAAFGRFAPIIEQAAAKGPEALAVLSSILATNPEFRKEVEPLDMQNRKLGSHGH